jgi:type III pantothenate kinase
MTTLCLDFGNSLLKAALFINGDFNKELILKNDSDNTIQEIIDTYKPNKSILSSVIDHNPEIESILNTHTLFHKVSANTKQNFVTKVSKPATIGPDRIALMAAAKTFFPNYNTLVIAAGSCITYNFINQYGHFLGGSISPGIAMRFKSMHDYTAKLPLVSLDWNIPMMGYDTKTNLQSGVMYGVICEIDGMIEKYQNKYNKFNVVLTGGNLSDFASQLKNRIFADAYFLFKGLYVLSEINNQAS